MSKPSTTDFPVESLTPGTLYSRSQLAEIAGTNWVGKSENGYIPFKNIVIFLLDPESPEYDNRIDDTLLSIPLDKRFKHDGEAVQKLVSREKVGHFFWKDKTPSKYEYVGSLEYLTHGIEQGRTVLKLRLNTSTQ